MQRVNLVIEKETGRYFLHRKSKKGNHVFRSVIDGSQWEERFTEPTLLYKWADIQFGRHFEVLDFEIVKTYYDSASVSPKVFVKG
ncbi:hypothetical protein [Paenibacillus sp. USHLN196]|uniref:hypothetical protein n=1 Tax=Paenibacillus sp. USHLN196 TaxID=3081291 RepID=UPI003017B082